MADLSCRNAAIDDDLDLSDSLNGRVAEILTDVKTYASLVDVVNSFPPAFDFDFDFNMIQKAPIGIVCQASRSITAHASPAHALSADNSDSPLLNLWPRASWGG